MKKTKQPKWARNVARDGWLPCVGGYRHINTQMQVVRTIDLNTPDDEAMWRVFNARGVRLGSYPSLTDAMIFADATATLMEDPG